MVQTNTHKPFARIEADLVHIIEKTSSLWPLLTGSNIFLTGGTGFFGKWLLSTLVWANANLNTKIKVVALTRNPGLFRASFPHLAEHPDIALLEGDVRNFAFPADNFSHIIHAATDASATLNAEDPLLMFDTIEQGTRRVLDFAVANQTGRLLLISSGGVYGQQAPDLLAIPENYSGAPDLCNPHSAYGEAKRVAELLGIIYAKQYGLQVVNARCFAFVGPYLNLDIHFAIGNFIRDGLNGGPIMVNGDGTPRRSYMYAADLVVWLLTLLVRGQAGQAYNVGSDQQVSIAELADTVSNCLPERPEVRVMASHQKGTPIQRYIPDITLAADQLGLTVDVSLKEAILKTIAWHQ